jgi:two-component system, OmpR family, response regulator
MYRVLLAEDDESLGPLLKEYLKAKSFEAELAVNGQEALKLFHRNPYDICVLDIMMPIKDGITLSKEIRAINSDIPIIFLTAKSLKEDVLEGFKSGADDYISKPFSMEELLYRMEAVLRRAKKEKGKLEFEIGQYHFDANKQTLTIDQTVHKLTTKESELLKLLCQNRNEVLERNFALKTIWIDDNYFNARSMDVYITKLRKYLQEDPSVEILNIHGKGFKLIS